VTETLHGQLVHGELHIPVNAVDGYRPQLDTMPASWE
jgi:hypothetical protein